MYQKILFLLGAVLSVFSACAASHQSAVYGGLSVSQAWIRQAPPNAAVLGLFMTIDNLSERDINIVSAAAKGFKRVELHRTINDNGIMKMLKQQYFKILAGGRLVLEPGSWHIMLMGFDKQPSKGMLTSVELLLDDGSSIGFPAETKAVAPNNHMNPSHSYSH